MDLNHKIIGEGEPIIIMHGLFGSLDNWYTFGKQLSKDRMVVLVDLRNHGRSPHVEGMTYPLMAEDLRAFMEKQWIHKAVIMGHSMGGKAAIQFAHDYPEMVEKLIVVDISPRKVRAGHGAIFEALASLPIDRITSRKEAEAHLSNHIEDSGVLQFLMKNIHRAKSGKYEFKMNLPVLYEQYPHIVDSIVLEDAIQVPTMIVYGNKSDYILPSDIPQLHEEFSNLDIHDVDSGHWVHAEKPMELLTLVREFIL